MKHIFVFWVVACILLLEGCASEPVTKEVSTPYASAPVTIEPEFLEKCTAPPPYKYHPSHPDICANAVSLINIESPTLSQWLVTLWYRRLDCTNRNICVSSFRDEQAIIDRFGSKAIGTEVSRDILSDVSLCTTRTVIGGYEQDDTRKQCRIAANIAIKLGDFGLDVAIENRLCDEFGDKVLCERSAQRGGTVDWKRAAELFASRLEIEHQNFEEWHQASLNEQEEDAKSWFDVVSKVNDAVQASGGISSPYVANPVPLNRNPPASAQGNGTHSGAFITSTGGARNGLPAGGDSTPLGSRAQGPMMAQDASRCVAVREAPTVYKNFPGHFDIFFGNSCSFNIRVEYCISKGECKFQTLAPGGDPNIYGEVVPGPVKYAACQGMSTGIWMKGSYNPVQFRGVLWDGGDAEYECGPLSD